MKKYIFPIILIFCLFFSFNASAYQVTGFEVTAKGAVLLSLDTDEILYSKNLDGKVYPASLAKLLSAIVVIENTPDLDKEMITMTQAAEYEILGTGASVVGFKVGEQVTAREALAALLIHSGGDCAIAIAHHYGGDSAGFMKMVNAKAQEIGMKNSKFGNPVGLHDENTYTTVNDLILLTKYALKYDIIMEIANQPRYTMKPTNMSGERHLATTNMLIDNTTAYYYTFADGLKTGFTDEAGRCLISTATYNGYKYLCILTGCKNDWNNRIEFLETANLYRWAFNNFSYKTIIEATEPITELPVRLSAETDFVSLYANKPLRAIFPDKADLSTVKIIPKIDYKSIDAPVKKGTVLGSAQVIYAEQVIGNVELVAGSDVEASTLLIIGDKVLSVVTSSIFLGFLGVIGAVILIFIIWIIIINRKPKKRKVRYIPYNEDEEKRK